MRVDLLECLSQLSNAFPSFMGNHDRKRQREVIDTYVRNLQDLPAAAVRDACEELVRTEEWFPSIAKIRSVAISRLLALPDEAEALMQIEARISWAKRGDDGNPPPVHLLVAQTLGLCGGFAAWRASEDPAVLRGQFGRLYREARARELHAAQAGTPLLPPGD